MNGGRRGGGQSKKRKQNCLQNRYRQTNMHLVLARASHRNKRGREDGRERERGGERERERGRERERESVRNPPRPYKLPTNL